MEQLTEIHELLELIPQPAFLVTGGRITYLNQAAQKRMIPGNISVSDILSTGAEEYAAFEGGCLYLALKIEDLTYGATVTRVDSHDIFCLDQDENNAELRAMALAAQMLREPLANLMISANRVLPAISDSSDLTLRNHAANINQSLHQILRLIGNMSDAARYSDGTLPNYAYKDLSAFLRELLEKVSSMAQQSGCTITAEDLPEAVICLVDEEKLERAVYNLLSNAMKFTPAGGRIALSLTQHGSKLHLSVRNSGSTIPAQLRSSIFSRYHREPAIEEHRQGIGLGMVMVRTAAAAHGGTVLVDQPAENETRVTMTLSMRIPASANLRSPRLKIDYAGEYDHALIELSDALPAQAYSQNN